MPFVLRREGEPAVVPTFTNHRLTGAVPSYTPTTSPWLHRSFRQGLPSPMGMRSLEEIPPWECGGISAVPTHIHPI